VRHFKLTLKELIIMKKLTIFGLIIFIVFSSIKYADGQAKKNNSSRYELEKDWLHVPKTYNYSNVSGISVDNNQNIFVFQRTGRLWTNPLPDSLISLPTITVLNSKSGKIINAWGANMFIMPHSITVDQNNNVWVTDVGLHQVFKFTKDGKVLMKLGVAKISGNDSTHFNLPTDVAVLKDGSFYVSDGYGNSRIVKFSKEGKYLFEWGKEGTDKGEFEIPHSIALDAYENVYVADRQNNRIEKFDPNGKFLKEWKNKVATKLYTLTFDKFSNHIIASDFYVEDTVEKGADIIELDTSLNVLSRFGRSGSYDESVSLYHDIAVDKQGNIYVVDMIADKPKKFKKIK
jgi:peptidylamidoglycolate lyase